MLWLVLGLFGRDRPLRDRAFDDIDGSWSGYAVTSATDDIDDFAYSNMTINFEQGTGENHIRITLTNETDASEIVWFMQKDPDRADAVALVSPSGDEIGEMIVKSVRDGPFYLFRGVLKPKNDQITVSLEENYLSIAISDQFSPNVTVMTFNQEFRNATINYVTKMGLLATVIVVVFVAMYKASDLADVIKPDEGAEASLIRAASRVDEQRKKKSD